MTSLEDGTARSEPPTPTHRRATSRFTSFKRQKVVVDKKSERSIMDAMRKAQAYEYLCHLESAKQWFEQILDISLPPADEWSDTLANGVVLARLASFFAPARVKRRNIYDVEEAVYQRDGLNFRHVDNTTRFLDAMKQIGFPSFYYPTVTDVYDRKNIPRLIYCIHALSFFLNKLGLAPEIQDLHGTAVFTDEQLDRIDKKIVESGVQLPSFDNLSSNRRKKKKPKALPRRRRSADTIEPAKKKSQPYFIWWPFAHDECESWPDESHAFIPDLLKGTTSTTGVSSTSTASPRRISQDHGTTIISTMSPLPQVAHSATDASHTHFPLPVSEGHSAPSHHKADAADDAEWKGSHLRDKNAEEAPREAYSAPTTPLELTLPRHIRQRPTSECESVLSVSTQSAASTPTAEVTDDDESKADDEFAAYYVRSGSKELEAVVNAVREKRQDDELAAFEFNELIKDMLPGVYEKLASVSRKPKGPQRDSAHEEHENCGKDEDGDAEGEEEDSDEEGVVLNAALFENEEDYNLAKESHALLEAHANWDHMFWGTPTPFFIEWPFIVDDFLSPAEREELEFIDDFVDAVNHFSATTDMALYTMVCSKDATSQMAKNESLDEFIVEFFPQLAPQLSRESAQSPTFSASSGNHVPPVSGHGDGENGFVADEQATAVDDDDGEEPPMSPSDARIWLAHLTPTPPTIGYGSPLVGGNDTHLAQAPAPSIEHEQTYGMDGAALVEMRRRSYATASVLEWDEQWWSAPFPTGKYPLFPLSFERLPTASAILERVETTLQAMESHAQSSVDMVRSGTRLSLSLRPGSPRATRARGRVLPTMPLRKLNNSWSGSNPDLSQRATAHNASRAALGSTSPWLRRRLSTLASSESIISAAKSDAHRLVIDEATRSKTAPQSARSGQLGSSSSSSSNRSSSSSISSNGAHDKATDGAVQAASTSQKMRQLPIPFKSSSTVSATESERVGGDGDGDGDGNTETGPSEQMPQCNSSQDALVTATRLTSTPSARIAMATASATPQAASRTTSRILSRRVSRSGSISLASRPSSKITTTSFGSQVVSTTKEAPVHTPATPGLQSPHSGSPVLPRTVGRNFSTRLLRTRNSVGNISPQGRRPRRTPSRVTSIDADDSDQHTSNAASDDDDSASTTASRSQASSPLATSSPLVLRRRPSRESASSPLAPHSRQHEAPAPATATAIRDDDEGETGVTVDMSIVAVPTPDKSIVRRGSVGSVRLSRRGSLMGASGRIATPPSSLSRGSSIDQVLDARRRRSQLSRRGSAAGKRPTLTRASAQSDDSSIIGQSVDDDDEWL